MKARALDLYVIEKPDMSGEREMGALPGGCVSFELMHDYKMNEGDISSLDGIVPSISNKHIGPCMMVKPSSGVHLDVHVVPME